MSASETGGGNREGPVAGPKPILHRSLPRRLLQLLAAFVAIDGAILLICPMYGGDCLYGFFTLIAFPVMLAGPAGVLLPRFAMRYAKDWRSRALISVSGALLLLGLVTISHAAAIRLLNFYDYGPVLVRDRLLIVQLGLAAIYYAGLSVIAFARAPARTG